MVATRSMSSSSTLVFAATLLVLGSASCGKKAERHSDVADKVAEQIAENGSGSPGSSGSSSSGAQAPRGVTSTPEATVRPPGPVGTISGKIILSGVAPKMPMLRRGSDPKCDTKPARAQTVLVGPQGSLANVVVRIKPGTVPAWTPSKTILVDQVDCRYQPRVQTGVRGQRVKVQNSDPTMHNVHARNLPLGRRQGIGTLVNSATPTGKSMSFVLGDESVAKLKCDYHGWMQGFVVVSDNPYSSVSAENGSFTIVDVPAGKQTLQLWHEYYGLKEVMVEVSEGGNVVVNASYDAAADDPMGTGATSP